MLVLKNLMLAGVFAGFAAPPAEDSAPASGEAGATTPPDGTPDPGSATGAEVTAAESATGAEATAGTPPGPTSAGDVDSAHGAGAPAEGPQGVEPQPPPGEPGAEPGTGGVVQPVGGAEPPTIGGPGGTKGNRNPKSRSHLKTGGISVAPGIGFGLITAGDKFCGQFSTDAADQDGRRALCTGATPWSMDFTAMYGVFDRLDISLGLRLNLQPRSFRNDECPSDSPVCDRGRGLFNNTLGVGIMPGVRIWGGEVDKIVKMGGAIDFLYMYESFSGYRNRPLADDEDDDSQPSEDGVSDHMLGLRAGPILQIDPHHNVGIFLIPAAVPSFRPARDGFDEAGWFEIAFEATLGVQGRFP